MMIEPVGGILLGWGVSKAADFLYEQASGKVQARLKQSELEGAIAQGIQAATKAEESLASSDKLFFRCDDKERRQFKSAAFGNLDVLEELQRPFQDAGKPRLEYLTAAFRQVAQEIGTSLNEQGLKRWLEEFAEAYFQKTSEICFRIALADYCEQLTNHYDDIKFLGIDDVDPNEESKQLETVFVMPDALREAKQTFPNYQGMDIDGGAIADRQAKLLMEQRRLSRESTDRWSGERISARKLLEQTESNRLVLLGAPGSGKTTLMSYFAVMLAKDFCRAYTQRSSGLSEQENLESPALSHQAAGRVLPILIRIRDLAVNPNLGILGYLHQFAEQTLACETLPGEFFETFLRDGKALILLDGLDEVADEGRRQDMVQKIDNFLGQYDQNRAIVTSRPAGYRRDFFRTSEYGHYQLQPFTDEQIQQFIKQWYDSRAQTPAEAERDRDSLWKALNDQARIKLLARNPLLLTIIALIHRYRADLPRDRFELYDRAVNTLIRTWDRKREITSHQVLQYLRLDDLRRLMEQLAYWIHSQGGVGDSEGGTLIDKAELLQQLGQFIREMKRIERHQAKAEAERFLQHIQERTGLLNEQGQDRYAFVHKTFQEYLTAQEIRDQQEEGFEVVLEHIRDHLHDPHWREVLLLLIAQQRRRNPAKCLQEILNCPDPYEKWLHRNLFFAGACLAEGIEVTDAALVDSILDGLVALEISDAPHHSRQIKAQVFKTLCALYETAYEQPALQRLLNATESKINKVRLQKYRAALGDRENAFMQLLKLLKSNVFPESSQAIRALAQIGYEKEFLVKELLALLKDKNSIMRYRAARTLIEAGYRDEIVEKELLSLLKSENRHLRHNIAFVLSNLRWNSDDSINEVLNDEVLNELILSLKDSDTDIRSSSAFVLANLAQKNEIVMKELLNLLKDKDANVRSSTASAFFELEWANKEVIDSLLCLLKDPNADVRSRAADALGNLGNGNKEVINTLFSLLKDIDTDVRSRAAAALFRLGQKNDEVLNELLCLLKCQDVEVRSRAAFSLGSLGNESEKVMDEMLLLLNDDFRVCSGAASTLGNLGQVTDIVISELLKQLQNREEDSVHFNVSNALSKLGRKNEDIVVPTLLNWLEQNFESTGAGYAVDTLLQLVMREE